MSKRFELNTNLLLFGLTVVALGVARHFHQFVLEQRALERAAPFLTNTFLLWLQVVLVLCLMLTALGLAARSRVGLSCSILGLLGVLVAHVGWYDYSRHTLKVFADDPLPKISAANTSKFVWPYWRELVGYSAPTIVSGSAHRGNQSASQRSAKTKNRNVLHGFWAVMTWPVERYKRI